MGPETTRKPPAPKRDELCWREMLHLALGGVWSLDQPLERMLDHVERSR
ncbi:MAG: hypothetical protein AAFR93_09080 [Pseudomonadota bacterium]